ncbi:hypothetical protein JK358_15780 [Nocardia sp. 2]|uniref:Uncharacterized protein n=1 Tax=Nocardia acididurans TaxID=2802282 RepID=A0ABS1M5L9_9NOCA|nr:hypothetical protein [Nocardia acididurans]MBL1075856.1 hypothetical protein [Nocardia acididurans]
MKRSVVARIGIVLAGVAAAAVVSAPAAQADYPTGACLVVDNQRSAAVTLTVRNQPYTGRQWTVPAHVRWVLLSGDQAIKNPERSWSITAPQGEWSYNSSIETGRGCNGSWIFTLR